MMNPKPIERFTLHRWGVYQDLVLVDHTNHLMFSCQGFPFCKQASLPCQRCDREDLRIIQTDNTHFTVQ